MERGQAIAVNQVTPEQPLQQPPTRFYEASLVKSMEGKRHRPSIDLASIIQVLQDRKYVRMERGRFIPEDRGRVVIAFWKAFSCVRGIKLHSRSREISWMKSPTASSTGRTCWPISA